MKRVVHGSCLDERFRLYRFYPGMLEQDLEEAYEGSGCMETMRKVLLPRLMDSLSSGDPEGLAMWLPFARRLGERIGYY